MTNYVLDYANNPDVAIQVPPLTPNSADTDLVFTGRGLPNFGLHEQTNFLKLLKNFASGTPPTNPSRGQLWFDSGMDSLRYWNGSIWRPVAANATNAGSTAPDNATEGELWYDASNNVLYVYHGNTWILATGAVAQVGPIAPLNAIRGQLWYDTNVRFLKIFIIDENNPLDLGVWALTIDPAFQYLALLM
jgi:hypothetical protein